jgi:D-lactate dehydrogenase
LQADTVRLVVGHDAVCVFVNDRIDAAMIGMLKEHGIKLIALRCAGYNNVDIAAAREAGILVVRVPAYSPYAVAEHTIGLLLALNRKIHRAYNRVREGNFSLQGLVGYDLYGKTFGLVGTGRIGRILAGIVRGFGCRLLVHDLFPDEEWAKSVGAEYVALNELYKQADFIALLAPLTHETFHMINFHSLAMMKETVIIVNTSRGGLIDTQALVDALKSGRIGGACLDVYEEEADFFYQDHSDSIISDDVLARLLTFNNVLITSHQAFLTHEALANIAQTTLQNVADFIDGLENSNQVVE